ncbi:RNA polymerase sigma factor [Candidatus Parcubacteria bacterium]|nr:MAG: RNA polymerase sigma factor [Candidatus Parcubacteria bacterium]
MAQEYLETEQPPAAAPAAALDIPDEVILASSQERPALFGLLVDRYQAPFLRAAQRVVGNRTDAEDVVQEAFVKIYRHAKKFRQGNDRKFSSWAYKIVLNTAITHYHRIKKRELPIPEEMDPTAEQAHDGFRKAMLERETAEVVRSVLEMMPADLRDLLSAYYLEDQAYQTIADRHGITIGALKMKLFRARKVFKKLLAS